LVRYEGHISEKHAKDAEGEVFVLPDAGIKERMSVDVLPDCKENKKYEAENEHYDDFWRFPPRFWSFPLTLLEGTGTNQVGLTSKLLIVWPFQ
jgi:hypothetical protein